MTLPVGFRLLVDERTRRHDGGRVLIGGSPRRVLRLTDRGATVATRLLDGAAVRDDGDAALARRLIDTGLAHPVPPAAQVSVEVVVPVYDDVAALDRCLGSLCGDLPITVVDDASGNAEAVAAVAARHRARLVRLPANRGPAAARNAGAARCTADVVAFVDSDSVTDVATLRRLASHFADPLVAAAAPRVRPLRSRGLLGAVAQSWSPLDLGAVPAPVRPTGRVAYVPSTVLLVRRDALTTCGGFDERMRFGEDVDLVWRLVESGARVRYDPTLQVRHAEPPTWSRWLRRRFTYGTSAAPLARRHGERAVPVTVQTAPAATVALAVAGHPAAAATVAGVTAWRLRQRLRAAAVPTREATTGSLVAPAQTALGAARWATQLWWPAVVTAAVGSRRARPAAVVALVAPPVVEWLIRRPAVDPVRWTLAVWADDAAYGLGVWRGCMRERTLLPLLPRISR